MQSDTISKAIEIVTRAIQLDNAGKYTEARDQYKTAMQYFVVGLRYEKNEQRKKAVAEQVERYMVRLEELNKGLSEGSIGGQSGGGGAATATRKPGEKGGGDDEGKDSEADQMKSTLASAIVAKKSNVTWNDVAGLEAAKEALKEAVILPVKYPQLFTGKRKPWKGILLYGPPGTGKSYLAEAVANEADSTFLSISSSNLVSKWQGESEKYVKNLFALAREKKPAIIFIDEIDSMCSARSEGENDSVRRMKTEFLVQMQGVGADADGILVLGATNTPWEIDAAMRRRFEKRIYIPLPEVEARTKMFGIHLGDTPHNLTERDFEILAEKTDGFSGSDISIVVRTALMEPVRLCRTSKRWSVLPTGEYVPLRDGESPPPGARMEPSVQSLNDIPDPTKLKVPDITMADFLHIIGGAKSSVAEKELKRFEEWTKEFGEEGS